MARTFEEALAEKQAARADRWAEREATRQRELEAGLDSAPIDWAGSRTKVSEEEASEESVRSFHENELDQILRQQPKGPR